MKDLMKKLFILLTVLFLVLGTAVLRTSAEEGSEGQDDEPVVETVPEDEEEKTDEETLAKDGEPTRNIVNWKISGTCEWSISDEGTLTIRPKDGASSGTLSYFGPIGDGVVTPVPWSNYNTVVKSVVIEKTVIAPSCWCMFFNFNNCTSMDLSGLDTSEATYMNGMFSGCSSLAELDVSHFNTGNSRTFAGMFMGCSKLSSIDVSGFNTENATNMGSMFSSCTNLALLEVGSFDTFNVETMDQMFHGCKSLASINVSGWDTRNVKNMNGMFYGCSSLKEIDVSGFKTGSLETMNSMFGNCTSLKELDVSNFDTSNVTSAYGWIQLDTNIIWLKVGKLFCANAANASNTRAQLSRQMCSEYDDSVYRLTIPYDVNEPVVYTVRYTLNYDGTSDKTYVYYKEDPVTLRDTSGLSRASVIIAWDTESPASKVVFEPGSEVDFKDVMDEYGEDISSFASAAEVSKTLYWAHGSKLTLSYDANGGENAPDSQSITDTLTEKDFTIAETTPTRNGYEFLGWASEASATEADYSAGGTITLTDDKTLFAVWKKNAEPASDTPYVLPKTGVDSIGMSYLPMAALGVLYLIKKNHR